MDRTSAFAIFFGLALLGGDVSIWASESLVRDTPGAPITTSDTSSGAATTLAIPFPVAGEYWVETLWQWTAGSSNGCRHSWAPDGTLVCTTHDLILAENNGITGLIGPSQWDGNSSGTAAAQGISLIVTKVVVTTPGTLTMKIRSETGAAVGYVAARSIVRRLPAAS